MIRLTLITILASVTSLVSQGQGWEKTYCDTGGFRGVFAIESYDKGFLIGGTSSRNFENSILYKTDVNGNILWQRIIGASGSNTNMEAICTTSDGGCAIVGEIFKPKASSEIFLIKLDACGEMDWAKKFIAGTALTTSNVCEMNDGGFVFNIEKYSDTATTNMGWVYRSDKNGNFVWSGFEDQKPLNISIDDSDNILVTGYRSRTQPNSHGPITFTSVYVTKLDSTGKQLMQGNYEGDNQVLGNQSLAASNGMSLTVGNAEDYNYALHLYLWNAGGKLLGNKVIIDSLNNLYPMDLIRNSNNSFILLADQSNSKTGVNNMRIFGIQSNAVVSKDTAYDLGFNISPCSIRTTSDGKYIISGRIINNGIYVAKINSLLGFDSFYRAKYNYDYLCTNTLSDTGTLMLDNAQVKDLAVDESRKPDEGFSLYPNPARGFIELSSSGLSNGLIQFSIYNILGSKILSSELHGDGSGNLRQLINLQNISDGCYVVELSQGGQISREKIIVEH